MDSVLPIEQTYPVSKGLIFTAKPAQISRDMSKYL